MAPTKVHRGDIWAVLEHFDVTYLRLLVVQMSATLENSQNIPKENSGHQVRTGAPKTKEHSAVPWTLVDDMFTYDKCLHFSSTWMSPDWNRIDK